MSDPTPAPAKLLPCQHEWEILHDGAVGCRKCYADKTVWEAAQENEALSRYCQDNIAENIRPPAAGELKLPDWPKRDGFCPVCNGNDYDVPCAYSTERPTGCWRAERLGLAARPKVEDGEVAALCAELRRPSGIGEPLDHAAMNKAADLLERLAGEAADNLKAAQGMSADVTNLGQQLETAEANLAEREAELAKAQDFVAECQSAFAELRDIGKSNARIDEIYRETSQYLNQRHAARQQQMASN